MSWDEMTPRERDALVQEELFGQAADRAGADWWYVVQEIEDYSIFDYPLPDYTTDISAAWQVVERMRGNSEGFASKFRACDWEDGYAFWFDGERDICGTAKTAPEAICLAALRAVGVEV